MLKRVKEFTIKGNVVDMAVGLMVGSAFGAVVKHPDWSNIAAYRLAIRKTTRRLRARPSRRRLLATGCFGP